MTITVLLRWAVLTFFLVATWKILAPFLGAALLAGILVISTWPLHNVLRTYIHSPGMRATILIFGWIVVLAVPLGWLSYILLGNIQSWATFAQDYVQTYGIPEQLPQWIISLPWIGSWLQEQWFVFLQKTDTVSSLALLLAEPLKDGGLHFIGAAMGALAQMAGVLILAWIFYYDGPRLYEWAHRLVGIIHVDLGPALLRRSSSTVAAVMLGLVGSGIGQAITMAIGLLVAGVPQVGLLTAATFFLSFIPIGPVVVWIGGAIYLAVQQDWWWMTFLLVWGALVVGSVDNVLKPILMSKGSDLSLVLMTLGVFGGVLAFGFVGLFLGPVILSVVQTLLRVWIESQELQNQETCSDENFESDSMAKATLISAQQEP